LVKNDQHEAQNSNLSLEVNLTIQPLLFQHNFYVDCKQLDLKHGNRISSEARQNGTPARKSGSSHARYLSLEFDSFDRSALVGSMKLHATTTAQSIRR
jgi:hypothetical protein